VASVFSHAFVGVALGACMAPPGQRARLLAVGAACAVVPDLDVAGLSVGFHLDHPLGHRGLSHSLPFAAALAGIVTVGLFQRGTAGLGLLRVWAYLFLATASHGLLDASTNGGRGVAFLAPFSDARYHFPFTPIEVSPINVRGFFTSRGVDIMRNEFVWIWLPSLALVAAAAWWHRKPADTSPSARGAPAPLPEPVAPSHETHS
jgi:inner membrane protein